MSDASFVRLSRGFFDHPFWEEERQYSHAEAWLDLVRSVAWQPRSTVVKGSIVKVPRGGIVASERFLSGRWMWSRTKVRAYLDLLEAEKMVRREKDHENTIIYLCNFAKYNPQKDQGKTTEEPGKDQIEEGKEGKEGSTSAREDDETESCEPPGFAPPVEKWVAAAARYLIPEWYARKRWEKYDASLWCVGRTPQAWRKLLPVVRRDFVNDGSPMKEPFGPIAGRQEKAIQPPAPSLHGKPCRIV